MIAVSANDVQFSLWRRDIVPTVADRYGLTDTSNAPGAGEENWGSDRTTANDMVTFLLRAAQDPPVGPSLLSWMALAEPAGADGFDQSFGVFALPGDRGVKQGWSDAGWSPANLHSVGWTERYFIAILQNSDTRHQPNHARHLDVHRAADRRPRRTGGVGVAAGDGRSGHNRGWATTVPAGPDTRPRSGTDTRAPLRNRRPRPLRNRRPLPGTRPSLRSASRRWQAIMDSLRWALPG